MERLSGEKKRVVVVGGGAGGSLIAKTLQNDADVFLVDTSVCYLLLSIPSHCFLAIGASRNAGYLNAGYLNAGLPFLAGISSISLRKEYLELPWANLRAMVEPSFAERSVINHSEYLPNVQIITSAATGITEHDVLTAQGRSIGYDYLVVATGHVHDGGFTKAERLQYFQAEQEKIKSANSVLIIGGGPTGVELAGEICVDFPDKKVQLVHRGSSLLEFIGEKAGQKALNWLTSKKVEVILGQSVKLNSKTDGVYETSGGEKIVADCHFLCVGQGVGSSWLRQTILKDSLDTEGRLMVDANLLVKGHPNVFGIGDITDVPELKLGYLAHNQALVAAKNLKLLMSGGGKTNLSRYTPAQPAAVVSLGRRDGIMRFRCLTLSGRIPGMIKSGDMFVGKSRRELGLSS
ncbi:apoptosis-inducing factorA-like [Dorcoceras hygrometricum]|uniref:Apoptosis-inducing factorA-like n=1 Tax=Dorcoceras hygrometricum TaxID=472368 RepID=A0A2Z7D758_9LAMI|nr:apoptosis-inducing factorA-like [Dorcoceras hygrometricum]